MKYFLLLTVFFSLGICENSFAQDSIVTTDGQKIKAKVLKINKKDVLYKQHDDPEFTTYTLLEKEVKTIKLENGKKYLFNHNLPRAFIGIGFDVYQPIGSFGRTDFEKGEPGFAMLGLGGNLNAGFYFTKRLGMHIRLGGSANRVDADAYKEYYADESDPDEVITVNYDSKENKQNYENWAFSYVALGPMYSFKPAPWLTIDTRLQIGFMNVEKPMVRIYASDSSASTGQIIPKYSIQSEKSSSKTFLNYGGGLSFRISPGRRIGFVVSADYVHTGGNINFKEALWSPASSFSPEPIYVEVDRTYNIDQIKFSLGIAYQFKRKNR